jgi:hypothetical protein
VPVRYLYGDSDSFPNGFDVLASVRAFVEAASRALALMGEADELERDVGKLTQQHIHELEALEAYFEGVVQMVAERAARAPSPDVVAPVARELAEQVRAMASDRRERRARELEASQGDIAAKVRASRQALREVISHYTLSDPLPVLSRELTLNLLGNPPSGVLSLEHPNSISTRFELDLAADPTWSRPRKLGEISQGTRLQVGTRTGLLGSAPKPDIQALDDYTIGTLEIGPAAMVLRVRKRPDQAKEELIIQYGNRAGSMAGEVLRGAKGEPFPSPPDDLATLERLAGALRAAAEPLIERKRALLDARIAGEDLFASNMTIRAYLDAVSDRLTPITAEVWARSPNARELSLKLEHEGGRREEIYLSISDLRAMIDPLPREAAAYFEKFDFLGAGFEIRISTAHIPT